MELPTDKKQKKAAKEDNKCLSFGSHITIDTKTKKERIHTYIDPLKNSAFNDYLKKVFPENKRYVIADIGDPTLAKWQIKMSAIYNVWYALIK